MGTLPSLLANVISKGILCTGPYKVLNAHDWAQFVVGLDQGSSLPFDHSHDPKLKDTTKFEHLKSVIQYYMV